MPRAASRFAGFVLNILFVTVAAAIDQPPGNTSAEVRNENSRERRASSEPGGPGGSGGIGGASSEPGVTIAWHPAASVANQNEKLWILRSGLSVEAPVWSERNDAISASFSIDHTHFSGSARLPDTKRIFPSDLWNVQAGLQHMHQFSSGSTSMLLLDIGSASDKPFNSAREINYMVGGIFDKPTKNGRDSWRFGALYSPLASLNFPIPLVAYQWNPTERFHMSIGLPFSINWQATDKLNLDVSYNPGGVDGVATYQWSERLRIYGGYQEASDQYYLTDRVDKREDAFFAVEQRVVIGLRRDFLQNFTLDINAGYAFDRYYGEGEDQQDLHDRVELEASAFLGARLQWGF